jgi:hypothetical protein
MCERAYHVTSLGGPASEDKGHCLAASERQVVGGIQKLAALKRNVLCRERACNGEAGKGCSEEGVKAHVEVTSTRSNRNKELKVSWICSRLALKREDLP